MGVTLRERSLRHGFASQGRYRDRRVSNGTMEILRRGAKGATPQHDRSILSGLPALLDDPGLQCFSYRLQTFCRNLIGCILRCVPVGVIKIDDIYGR